MPVGVADRYVGDVTVVLAVDGQDLRRREPVDGGHDRGRHQPAVGERQEVEAVVDQVETHRPARTPRRCAGTPTPWGLGWTPSTSEYPLGRHPTPGGPGRVTESAVANRVTSTPRGDQALGQEGDELLPGPVVPGWDTPGDRSQQGYAHERPTVARSDPDAHGAAGSPAGRAGRSWPRWCRSRSRRRAARWSRRGRIPHRSRPRWARSRRARRHSGPSAGTRGPPAPGGIVEVQQHRADRVGAHAVRLRG